MKSLTCLFSAALLLAACSNTDNGIEANADTTYNVTIAQNSVGSCSNSVNYATSLSSWETLTPFQKAFQIGYSWTTYDANSVLSLVYEATSDTDAANYCSSFILAHSTYGENNYATILSRTRTNGFSYSCITDKSLQYDVHCLIQRN